MTIPTRTFGQGLEVSAIGLAEVEAAASRIENQGARYPDQLEQLTYR
ncbi:MAG TPA: hypothetical protein VF327_01650 [Gaiellaceae bacterium]